MQQQNGSSRNSNQNQSSYDDDSNPPHRAANNQRNDVTTNVDLRYSPNGNSSYKTTNLKETNNRHNQDREDRVTDLEDAPNYRVHTANRNISTNRNGGRLRDHSSSSRSPNGISSDQENLVTDHEDATLKIRND